MTVVAQPTRQGTIIRSVRTRIVDWVPAIVVFFAAIARLAARRSTIFNIQRFLLPKPWAIVQRILDAARRPLECGLADPERGARRLRDRFGARRSRSPSCWRGSAGSARR